MTTRSTPNEEAQERALADARADYARNTDAVAHRMLELARLDYLNNAPAWNFVQGNLVYDNDHLRRKNTVLVRALALTPFALAAVIMLVVWMYRPSFIAIPVDQFRRAVAGAFTLSYIPGSAADAEIVRCLTLGIENGFSNVLEPDVNRHMGAVADKFFFGDARQTLATWRTIDNSKNDPYVLAKQGITSTADVDVKKIQKIGNSWIIPFTITYENKAGEVLRVENHSITTNADSERGHSDFKDNPFGVSSTSMQIDGALGLRR